MILAGLGPEPSAEDIKGEGLDGILIGSTSGRLDYEYGFISGVELAYVGYELPPDGHFIDEDALEMFFAQPKSKLAFLKEIRNERRERMRVKLAHELAEREKSSSRG